MTRMMSAARRHAVLASVFAAASLSAAHAADKAEAAPAAQEAAPAGEPQGLPAPNAAATRRAALRFLALPRRNNEHFVKLILFFEFHTKVGRGVQHVGNITIQIPYRALNGLLLPL